MVTTNYHIPLEPLPYGILLSVLMKTNFTTAVRLMKSNKELKEVMERYQIIDSFKEEIEKRNIELKDELERFDRFLERMTEGKERLIQDMKAAKKVADFQKQHLLIFEDVIEKTQANRVKTLTIKHKWCKSRI